MYSLGAVPVLQVLMTVLIYLYCIQSEKGKSIVQMTAVPIALETSRTFHPAFHSTTYLAMFTISTRKGCFCWTFSGLHVTREKRCGKVDLVGKTNIQSANFRCLCGRSNEPARSQGASITLNLDISWPACFLVHNSMWLKRYGQLAHPCLKASGGLGHG
jgi:hypothetical protein